VSSSPDRRGGVLFLLRSPAYVRNFESVLRSLAGRGHAITVLFEERKEGGDEAGLSLVAALAADLPALRWELRDPRPLGLRGRVRMALEAGQDYLRYFEGPLGGATRLRERALGFLPSAVEHAIAAALRRWPRGRRALASVARRLDRLLGDDPCVVRELERRRPEVLVVSPLIHFRSRQADWVRAARVRGIPSLLCVYSWDNLTTKGVIHALPDRVAVWNEAQRRDVIELHGAAADSIVVAGAWPYDHWFEWRAGRSRDDLCRQLGLAGERPLVLYVCSSRFIAEHERQAVERWVRAIRSSADPRVASASVIVRPHPLNGDEWGDAAPAGLPGVAVFPPGGADPVDDPSRSDYFDSMANADAVVGVNTSALLESAIVDRPALALPEPEFRSSQQALPHFRELAGEQGILSVARSMADHLAQLGASLADPGADAWRRRRFVETFLRPGGAAPSPAERVASLVEELAGAGSRSGSPV
jgi:hypothetical protein